jgi:hypothetical protein
MTIQEVSYGSDHTGRLWRAYPKPDQPALTVLEVSYPDRQPKYDVWGILTESDMVDITDQNEIFWAKNVIEV